MPNPWDPFPFPAMGDEDLDVTYAGVGACLSQWEAIEFSFARVQSVFLNDPDGESLRAYGTGTIFQTRIDSLSEHAAAFFIGRPSQELEGEFSKLVDRTLKFSNRRNEVAHGIVMDVRNVTFFQNKMPLMRTDVRQCVLVPPWHKLRWHKSGGLPDFAYNGMQLQLLATRFYDLEGEIDTFRKALLERLAKRRKP
jgi:hypothetical protein